MSENKNISVISEEEYAKNEEMLQKIDSIKNKLIEFRKNGSKI